MALIQLDHTPQTVKVLPAPLHHPSRPRENGGYAPESTQGALPAARPQR